MHLSQEKKLQIAKSGKLYRPASDHFPDIVNPVVECDNCKKTGLLVSIGSDDGYDLCLSCVENFIQKEKYTNKIESDSESDTESKPMRKRVTKMKVDMYNNKPNSDESDSDSDNSCVTLMQIYAFKKEDTKPKKEKRKPMRAKMNVRMYRKKDA